MSIDDYLTEIADRGWTLRYLRQNRRLWEAMLARPIEIRPSVESLTFHVGFGCGRSASAALLDALETAETDASLETCALQPADLKTAPALSLAAMMKDLVPMANQFKLTRRLL